ncbi:MAG: DNA/RNA non-specific endonuclease, partial [Dehalococcoidia bacterium]|nr:DNA/RNA non-specific endonuclease [Dehalococcoidia bacterium]
PLAQPIVQPQPSPFEAARPPAGDDAAGPRSEIVDDELRVTIPVRVAVRVGASPAPVPARGPAPGAPPAAAPAPAPPGAKPSGIETVSVDQSNYAERGGYRPDFLGDGDLRVPLPVVTKASLKRQVLKQGAGSDGELKYWTYSVVMNKARRLAFFSAANVDAERRPRGAGRDGDRWFADTRIAPEAQLGAEFYGQQREFEADRDRNPFDRGHLTRRLDAQWGTTSNQAKRNGDDSFHWTNCSPQHYRFNQGAKLWLGLEDYVIDGFAGDSGRRACVLNGPVFDAPLSALDAAGRVTPDLKGRAHPDPIFGEVAIPKLFFKVVACARAEGGLAAAAFLMSQEDLLSGVSRIHGMPPLSEEKLSNAEARLYQVPMADLASLTGLDFGPLETAEVTVAEAAGERRPRLIERLEDLRLLGAV